METYNEMKEKADSEKERVELRSEKVRNMIGEMPSSLIRWGNTIMVVIFVSLALIAGFVLASCGKKAGPEVADGVTADEEVTFYKQTPKKLTSEIMDRFLDKPRYILLKSMDNRTDFGKISQIDIANGRIYILDKGIKALLVYGMDGTAIGKVGTCGQGPDEYVQITSFDVDDEGVIYMIDGRLDMLFIYNPDLTFRSRRALSFEVDHVHVSRNGGGFLFALSSWNQGEASGYKIVRTDRSLRILNTYLPYDEYVDDNYWISDYRLLDTDQGILYNQPIDNDIHVFSADGEYRHSVRMDFGKENVPDAIKKDIERSLQAYDDCCLLRNFSVVTSRMILGTVWRHRENRMFLLDRRSGQVYLGDRLDDSDNTLCTGFQGSTLISFIHPDYAEEYPGYKELPREVLSHVEEENFVICLRELKAF